MITLEGQQGFEIQISYKKKRKIFDRALQRAVGYSLLFHILLVGLFKVKLAEIHDPEVTLQPVEVAIDSEEIAQQVAVADVSHDDSCILPTNPDNFKFPLFSVNTLDPVENSDYCVPKLETPTPSFSINNSFTERLYPLKLHLSKPLTSLTIIEDGSSLFKEKKNFAKAAELPLATSTYPITYTISVVGSTGKIVSWKRKKELLDKRLQECADKLIQKICFAPTKDKILRGKISLTFYVSGQDLQGFLDD